jgi:RNA polymerase sigma factor (sigma-70 family)
MADANVEFERLMERLRAGEPAAVEELCRKYADHVLRAVRRKLQPRMRRQYDSTDFMQDVWGSFVAVPPETFTFATPQDLIHYLAGMAAHKVLNATRGRYNTAKRGAASEQPILQEPAAPRNESASQVAIAGERWQQLIEGLTPPQRQVVQLLQEGFTYAEIAGRLNLHPKAIQRLIQMLAERVES